MSASGEAEQKENAPSPRIPRITRSAAAKMRQFEDDARNGGDASESDQPMVEVQSTASGGDVFDEEPTPKKVNGGPSKNASDAEEAKGKAKGKGHNTSRRSEIGTSKAGSGKVGVIQTLVGQVSG